MVQRRRLGIQTVEVLEAYTDLIALHVWNASTDDETLGIVRVHFAAVVVLVARVSWLFRTMGKGGRRMEKGDAVGLIAWRDWR